ncbi:disulfide bond formation protein B [Sneathiella glossodoripedis]|uniref:disulfide bond formation protein B n=1 Tax=Sneathiella glossodoripedis TaxID=418853 RepID=UPI00046FD0DE|nr:disulfide bond formation protein B [Sneathiella glossodoripedis]
MSRLYDNALVVSLFVSVAVLVAVFVAQYGFDLKPCVLCVYQRWPYGAVILLSILGILASRYVQRKYLLLICALAFATTASIAFYHVGVEQHWWLGTSSCTADAGKVNSLAELKAQIMAAPITKCDEIAWQLFGISMAGYNFILAALMVIFTLLSAKREFMKEDEHDGPKS